MLGNSHEKENEWTLRLFRDHFTLQTRNNYVNILTLFESLWRKRKWKREKNLPTWTYEKNGFFSKETNVVSLIYFHFLPFEGKKGENCVINFCTEFKLGDERLGRKREIWVK